MESHHDTLKTLGRAIRHRRWRYKMSMKDLAKASGVCFHSINDYEHGLAQPSIRNLLKICGVLNMQITLTPNEDVSKLEY